MCMVPNVLAAPPAPMVGAPPVMAPAMPLPHAMMRPARMPSMAIPPAGPHRWEGGMRAPGGWSAFRRPAFGFRLPQFWIAPSFFIGDWGAYGLGRPAPGFGWSRYYDDAVLTDQWGRVYDVREDVDWDGGHRGRDRDYDHDRDGHHTRHYRTHAEGFTYRGQWTGHWDGEAERTYSGEWRGGVRPHWGRYGQSAVAYGYGDGYGPPIVTTVTTTPSAPKCRTIVSYKYETVRARRTAPKRSYGKNIRL
ncbi:MAG: RcnB family protein [Sphingomonadaceae bacterium]|nr:RcnB family protein [Sphingomonadaceae bacterium]